MHDRLITMQELCLEAVRRRGTDIEAIERYVRDRIDAMGEGDRVRLRQEIARVLRFRAPVAGEGALH
ncbi:MAG: hypothetical protein NVSMB26_01980 [Beijerinckiaceae bacterium]